MPRVDDDPGLGVAPRIDQAGRVIRLDHDHVGGDQRCCAPGHLHAHAGGCLERRHIQRQGAQLTQELVRRIQLRV